MNHPEKKGINHKLKILIENIDEKSKWGRRNIQKLRNIEGVQ